MTPKLEWQEIALGCSIAEFAAQNNLEIQSLNFAHGVMILPNDATLSVLPEQHLFSAHAKEVLFVLRESDVDAVLYQDSRERRELVLKSATVVLPTIYFLGGLVGNVALGVLANWIYNRFIKDRQSEPPPIIKFEAAELKSDGSVRWRRAEGPSDQVSKLLLEESKRLKGEVVDEPPGAASTNPRSLSQWNPDQKTKRKNASRKREG